jgi:quercetin dioxygenase-like cupin family protein
MLETRTTVPAIPAIPALPATMARSGLPAPRAAVDMQGEPLGALLLSSLPDEASPARPAATGPLRRRLFERVAASAAQSRALHTRRLADAPVREAATGVTVRELYRAAEREVYLASGQDLDRRAGARRPGEPETALLIELAPGARWAGPTAALQRELLVLRGRVAIGGATLDELDYHVVPAGVDAGEWACADAAESGAQSDVHLGALVYLREGRREADAPEHVHTQRAEAGEWAEFGPGIKRRVLWRQGPQAALLYHTLPGAEVPHHGHGHDEECLMLAGDFFLDDVLLRALDYQIAPAGSEHRGASTDTGLVLFARGDLEMKLK